MPRPTGKSAGAASLPRAFDAQLATLVDEPPTGDDWLHELKYDGYRMGCRVVDGDVQLLSRNGKDWTEAFPEVCDAARALPGKRIFLDGEVVVLGADGRTSFQELQNAIGSRGRRGLTYFAFDLLHLDGEDLRPKTLDERKEVLQRLLRRKPGQRVIRYAEHVIGDGARFFAHACNTGIEGIVSKLRTQPYQPGRNTTWLKIKCLKRQELVIGGFTEPAGSREGLGALLLGVHDARGRLAFAGRVGTGFSQKSARELRRRLDALRQPACPFDPAPTGPDRHAHWVRPELVAEVRFSEWTSDGKVRHASFQGLREDKTEKEVVKEVPVNTSKIDSPRAPRARTKKAPAGEGNVAGVRLSHPERVLFPAAKVTKLALAEYYQSIEKWILPHVQNRPLSLVRCPNGLTDDEGGGCFYMKHISFGAPKELRRVRIQERTKVGEYLVIDDLAGLVALAQMNVLEIHTWNSLADDLEHPTRVVFDLDPGPKVAWADVVAAARLVHDTLEAMELESFVKTTGGHGLHVVVPLSPSCSWDDGLAFSRDLSSAIARRDPQNFTVAIPKAGREKKILIDYLRNTRGATSVAAFSPRAKVTAPVSVPLTWSELSTRQRSDHFTVPKVPARLTALRADPWKAYWKCRQKLTPRILRAVAESAG